MAVKVEIRYECRKDIYGVCSLNSGGKADGWDRPPTPTLYVLSTCLKSVPN